MEIKLIQPSLPSILVIRSSLLVERIKTITVHKHFHLHAQRWSCRIQGIASKDQHSSNKILVHVVKQGETLTSISKLYGVSISEIAAANKDIVDVDLVFEGQQLKVPSFIAPPLQMAKTTGYFLVLVPLIGFCIRCIIGALCNRVSGDLKHNVNASEEHHHGSKQMRWKFALQDLRDPDAPDTDTRTHYDHTTEDEDQINTKDVNRDYTALERDYQKFRSECGISKWGYWRGGSPN